VFAGGLNRFPGGKVGLAEAADFLRERRGT
jgi:hypothetical protein